MTRVLCVPFIVNHRFDRSQAGSACLGQTDVRDSAFSENSAQK